MKKNAQFEFLTLPLTYALFVLGTISSSLTSAQQQTLISNSNKSNVCAFDTASIVALNFISQAIQVKEVACSANGNCLNSEFRVTNHV